jgi:diguanylate cyclase (GGDEF)-like protein/PAS domain S-box-containing protein
MLGYRPEDLMGRHSHPIWHHSRPDGSLYPEEECRIYQTARDGRSRHTDDEVFWKKDGSCIPVEYITTPMREGDRITGTVVTFRDITERRRAEEALRLSESRFRNLFRQSALSMQIFSPDGRTLEVNPALEQLWGVTADSLKDYNILEDRQLEEKGIMPYIRKGFAGEAAEAPVVRYDPSETTRRGRVRWVKAFIYAVKSDAGKVLEVVLMHVDVTEMVEAEAALRESEARFRGFFELAAVGAVQIEPLTGRFLRVNDRFCQIIGYSREELLTRTFRDITHPDDRVLDEKFFEQVRNAALAEYSTEKRYVHKKGHVIWAHVSATIIRDREGRPVSTAGIVQEITDRKLMEEEIRYMAQHDTLTGLPNRSLFSDILAQEVAQAERDGKKLALLFVDLDRFKEVNDRLGHEVGDQLLRETALRLRKLLRKADSIGRIGGDEFNIVLADIVRAEDVADIAAKLVEGFRQPFPVAGRQLRVTISVGIAFFPDDGRDIDSVLRAADMAMYHAKQRGRDQYEFYNASINLASLERLKLESMLRRSLELGEMVTFYQPLFSLRTRRVVCAEALVRWNHPEKGLLVPGDFLHATGADGFMTALDDWVLNRVCRQMRTWLNAGIGPGCITVNLSARQFERPDLVAGIASVLAATGAPPGGLTFEIPESIIMRRGERSAERLKELAGLGVHLSIDDFGTGCSSLNHLKRLPIERLKIDRSLVRDVTTDWHSRSIMRAVTLMAHAMKLKVVAKGVETEAQLASVREAGCDEVQGYLFGRPMPADEFRELAEAGK